MRGGLFFVGAIGFGKGRILVGGQVLPQAFRIGVDVQVEVDADFFAVVEQGEADGQVATDGRGAVDAAGVIIPGEATVNIFDGEAGDGQIGGQGVYVGLSLVGVRQWRQVDGRGLRGGRRGGGGVQGHGSIRG